MPETKNKIFSLILNSRGRVNYLRELLDSIIDTTWSIDKLEVLVRYDDDDSATKMFFEGEGGSYKFLTGFCGPRIKNVHTSLNELARKSSGKYVFVLNDDVLITTPLWDQVVLSKINWFKDQNGVGDDVLLIQTSDSSVDKSENCDYASFPIISREAFEILGYILHEDFVGLGGDSHIHRIFEAVGRIVDCKGVVLDHVLHNSLDRVINPDETAARMRLQTYKHQVNPFEKDISEDVQKLTNHINKQTR